MIDGQYPIEELSRLETADGGRSPARRPARTRRRPASKGKTRSRDTAIAGRARDRLREFFKLRDDALFQDTQLTGLDPIGKRGGGSRVDRWRHSRLFAADGQRGRAWTLGAAS